MDYVMLLHMKCTHPRCALLIHLSLMKGKEKEIRIKLASKSVFNNTMRVGCSMYIVFTSTTGTGMRDRQPSSLLCCRQWEFVTKNTEERQTERKGVDKEGGKTSACGENLAWKLSSDCVTILRRVLLNFLFKSFFLLTWEKRIYSCAVKTMKTKLLVSSPLRFLLSPSKNYNCDSLAFFYRYI